MGPTYQVGVIWARLTRKWAGKLQSVSGINNVPGSKAIICFVNTVSWAMSGDHSINLALLLHLKALFAGIRAMS